MQLVEVHQIGLNHKYYDDMCHLTHLSKNLYNATLYAVRQHFFSTGEYLQYKVAASHFARGNPDYKALPLS